MATREALGASFFLVCLVGSLGKAFFGSARMEGYKRWDVCG
jgi:hypothetical protein